MSSQTQKQALPKFIVSKRVLFTGNCWQLFVPHQHIAHLYHHKRSFSYSVQTTEAVKPREVLDLPVFSALRQVPPQQRCIQQDTALPCGDRRVLKKLGCWSPEEYGSGAWKNSDCLDTWWLQGLNKPPLRSFPQLWKGNVNVSLFGALGNKQCVFSIGQESQQNILPAGACVTTMFKTMTLPLQKTYPLFTFLTFRLLCKVTSALFSKQGLFCIFQFPLLNIICWL